MNNLAHYSQRRTKESGFALVVTLSLMILLTVIAVGLLSLSSISLRSATRADAMERARSNARIGLMLAIGDLQKHAGQDQRITATADIAGDATGNALVAGATPNIPIGVPPLGLSAVQPGTRYWTGVFANTETTNPLLRSFTNTPSASIVQWLVSSSSPITALGILPSPSPSDAAYAVSPAGEVTDPTKAVVLAGRNTVGNNSGSTERYVVAPLVNIMGANTTAPTGTPTGRYAWWVGDEGVKAKINIPKIPKIPLDVKNYAALVAQRRGWETVTGFSAYPDPSSVLHESLPKVISLPETALLLPSVGTPTAGASPLQGVFHSATADSMGLLTDSLTGGMKIDLTAILSGNLPTTSPLPSVANYPVKNSNIIPAQIASQPTAASSMLAPRWDIIRNFYNQSQQLDGGALVVKGASSVFEPAIAPVVTDFRILMGARIKVKDETLRKYNICACGKIAIAIANPYSYPLKWTNDIEIQILNQTPAGNAPSRIWGNLNLNFLGPQPALIPQNSNEAAVFNNAVFRIPVSSLQPGEVRAYTLSSPVKRSAGSTSKVDINLAAFASSSPFDFNNCVELDNSYEYILTPGQRFELDIRESYQTSLANVEIGLASTAVGSRLLRKIERFELDNGYYAANQRHFYHTIEEASSDSQKVAKNMTQPFPLMLYSFQISQPGGEYQDYMPAFYEMGQRASTLRTFADFNLQATRVRKPITSYNPPPYFAESIDDEAQLAAGPPGGDTGPAFPRDLLIPRWGRSSKTGSEKTILFSIPSQFASLAQLQHADLTGDDLSASIAHQPGNAFGNSYASPFVKRELTAQDRTSYELRGTDYTSTTPIYPTKYYDLSHLLNTALWDGYFFSTIPRTGSPVPENPTLVRFNPDDPSANIQDATGVAVAPLLFVDGAFNINSTDKNAWKAFLASARHFKHNADTSANPEAAFPRGLEQISSSANPPTGHEADSFSGFRRLTDPQLDALAAEIVKQVRLRGPFVSVSHFVNRALAKIEVQPALTRSGALQSAIDESGANIAFQATNNAFVSPDFSAAEDKVTVRWKAGAPRADFDGTYAGTGPPPTLPYARTSLDSNYGTVASIYADTAMLDENYALGKYVPEQGFRSTGIPGWLTQADVLQVIGPSITAKSDTFRIRAYGEALDASGITTAKAWCEAIIQRTPSYVDPANAPTARGAQLSNINKIYGRKYQIISFRWLSPQEI